MIRHMLTGKLSHTEIYKSTSCTKKPEENDAELHIMIMGREQAEQRLLPLMSNVLLVYNFI